MDTGRKGIQEGRRVTGRKDISLQEGGMSIQEGRMWTLTLTGGPAFGASSALAGLFSFCILSISKKWNRRSFTGQVERVFSDTMQQPHL
jgi:hypothetical protein